MASKFGAPRIETVRTFAPSRRRAEAALFLWLAQLSCFLLIERSIIARTPADCSICAVILTSRGTTIVCFPGG